MTGDFIIIFLAIASAWSVYKLFTMEAKYSTSVFCLGLFLTAFLIGGIIIPNKELLNGIFTPEINGIFIDTETGKPVPDIDLVIVWGCSYGKFPYHSGFERLKTLNVTSDSNGKFYAPSRYKSLAIMLFPLYNRDNSNFYIKIFNLDYEWANSTRNGDTRTLLLKKIRTNEAMTKTYRDLEWSESFGDTTEKSLATAYKDKYMKKLVRDYGVSRDALDRIYGR